MKNDDPLQVSIGQKRLKSHTEYMNDRKKVIIF